MASAGVFSVIAGDRDAGQALASNPAVSMVSFTGSSATGSKIMTSCAPRLAQTMLELGGKSALVMCVRALFCLLSLAMPAH